MWPRAGCCCCGSARAYGFRPMFGCSLYCVNHGWAGKAPCSPCYLLNKARTWTPQTTARWERDVERQSSRSVRGPLPFGSAMTMFARIRTRATQNESRNAPHTAGVPTAHTAAATRRSTAQELYSKVHANRVFRSHRAAGTTPAGPVPIIPIR
eukprot:5033556-Prymnesium_polylepis.2